MARSNERAIIFFGSRWPALNERAIRLFRRRDLDSISVCVRCMRLMRNLLVLTAALALASGCTKKKEENKTPPPPPAAGSGSGSAEAGSGSAVAAAPAADPKLVERGAYIAKTAGCLVCHTALGPQGPDMANMGAGGLSLEEKFGTWTSPNITPDKGTGIGNWTDDQIIAAVREGVRPDGSKLYPIMPYMNFNVMTDDDAKALVTFLRTLKPVDRSIAKFELKMAAAPAPKPPNVAPGDDPAKKGAYLASLMLCSHCHWTPNKDFTAPAGPDKLFSGGLPMELPPMGKGVLFSRNLTSDPETGLGKWTEDQVVAAIKTMTKPDGKMIQGPMLFMQGGWSQLPDDDIKVVAQFIKALPAVKNKVPASTFVPNPPGPPPGAGSGAPAGGSADPHAGHDMGGGAPAGSAAAGSGSAK
jgi:cytochrome c553